MGCTRPRFDREAQVNSESESKKIEEAGGGGVRDGTSARKPLDFEKRPLIFTAEFISVLIDNLSLSAQIVVFTGRAPKLACIASALVRRASPAF